MNKDFPMSVAKKINALEEQARGSTSHPASFDVNSENSPAMLTAGMNDYDPGNFDVLRIFSNGAYTITGLAGGQKGRALKIINVGGYVITFSLNSTSSLAENRIIVSTAADASLSPNKIMDFYYDSTTLRWRTNG